MRRPNFVVAKTALKFLVPHAVQDFHGFFPLLASHRAPRRTGFAGATIAQTGGGVQQEFVRARQTGSAGGGVDIT